MRVSGVRSSTAESTDRGTITRRWSPVTSIRDDIDFGAFSVVGFVVLLLIVQLVAIFGEFFGSLFVF